jgi:tetratricopeptide (TPR) repeat protein
MLERGDRAHRMFLAMAHWRLGNQEKARELYAQGAVWIASNRRHDEKLNRFRAEAEQLMEITEAGRLRLLEQYLAANPMDPASLAVIGMESPEGLAIAVKLALTMELPTGPRELLVYAEYLLIGGETVRAVHGIQEAIAAGGREHWYQKSLGWALRSEGRTEAAEAAFKSVLAGMEDWSSPPSKADPDHWTAAYFLDLVTAEQYAERWRNDARFKEKFACFPWFYIGQRMEIEGRREGAVEAYRKSVELGTLPDAHYIHHWSAYRLHVVTGEPLSTRAGAAGSGPTTQTSTRPAY